MKRICISDQPTAGDISKPVAAPQKYAGGNVSTLTDNHSTAFYQGKGSAKVKPEMNLPL
jgi:hypothetical protein